MSRPSSEAVLEVVRDRWLELIHAEIALATASLNLNWGRLEQFKGGAPIPHDRELVLMAHYEIATLRRAAALEAYRVAQATLVRALATGQASIGEAVQS